MIEDKKGLTPLETASSLGFTRICRFLAAFLFTPKKKKEKITFPQEEEKEDLQGILRGRVLRIGCLNGQAGTVLWLLKYFISLDPQVSQKSSHSKPDVSPRKISLHHEQFNERERELKNSLQDEFGEHLSELVDSNGRNPLHYAAAARGQKASSCVLHLLAERVPIDGFDFFLKVFS